MLEAAAMMSSITHDDQVTLEALVWGGGAGHSELGQPWARRPRDTGQSGTDGPSDHHRQPSASVPGGQSGLPSLRKRSATRTGGDTDQREGHVPGRTLAAEGAWQ